MGIVLIIHREKETPVEMLMHFPDPVFIDDKGFLYPEKLLRQFFLQQGQRLIGKVFLTINRMDVDIFILRFQVTYILKFQEIDPVACFYYSLRAICHPGLRYFFN